MNKHKSVILAALRDYEYKLDAHYDGHPDALEERDAARAAIAYVEAWQPQQPNTEGLLPCLSCKGTPSYMWRGINSGEHKLECTSCHTQTAWYATEAEAEAAWNRRAPQQPAMSGIPHHVRSAIGDVWGFVYADAQPDQLERAASSLMDWAHEVKMQPAEGYVTIHENELNRRIANALDMGKEIGWGKLPAMPQGDNITVKEYMLQENEPFGTDVTLRRMRQRDGSQRWGIFRGHSTTLNTDGEWELMPASSSMTDDYLERNRHIRLKDALDAWHKYRTTLQPRPTTEATDAATDEA